MSRCAGESMSHLGGRGQEIGSRDPGSGSVSLGAPDRYTREWGDAGVTGVG